MASSSSSSSRSWRYHVFTSFHGPDVRKTFLSHLRKQFSCNGISMFDDQGIERSQTIASSLTRAISESRISIVVFSKNYPSSSWCLDELLGILNCKEATGQIVMTIFYGVDPSDVRKQTGDFGRVFNETCRNKTKEEKRRWSQALTHVGNIAGEHFLNWDDESKMIEKTARDVSNKLNTRISKDFEGMVGIEEHLEKMQSLLNLQDDNEAMIVGICGPAGIGKTTIARALHSRLSSCFQLTCFMENLRGSYNSGLDEYGLKLCLQEKLLSKLFNQNDMKLYHLGAVEERLRDLKVLIVLDDVDDLKQLEALAYETNWFGPGSRVIVTTEDTELLEQHGINNTYHVDFPTKEEARRILCRYAFRQVSPPFGFENLVERVTQLCSNLPLGLRVIGSSLRRKKEDDWESILLRLENSLHRDIGGVLRVGYDSLHKDDQFLFCLIACFFKNQDDDRVKAMLSDSNLDVRLGLKTLEYKSLIQRSKEGTITMHKLLQQVGREAVHLQEPKRQILTDSQEICDFLENDYDNTSVMGISLDLSTIPNVVSISARAFKRMRNVRFLRVYETRRDIKVKVDIPDDMDFPPRLRLLHWEVYPEKCLPRMFMPEYLVELNLGNSKLENLWQGTQPLTNLKKMVLSGSLSLKEVPDLSNATNLKSLDLHGCLSLVEFPSSIENLHNLEELEMNFCISLQVVPTHLNLTSLESLRMIGCWQLRKIPEISTNIKSLVIGDTMLEEYPQSLNLWSRLETLNIYGSVKTVAPLWQQGHSSLATIESLPEWIKDLHCLKWLYIAGCPNLTSLPELPRSLIRLTVDFCESLETVSFESIVTSLYFPNCYKLGEEARRVIIQQSFRTYIPGKEVPAEFDHRAIGSSLTVRPSVCKFRICVLLSPKPEMEAYVKLVCRMRLKGSLSDEDLLKGDIHKIQAEHLYIFHVELIEYHDEILFKFSTTSSEVEIIECGVQVLEDETDVLISSSVSSESCLEQVSESDEKDPSDESYECDEPKVNTSMGCSMFLSFSFLFLMCLLFIYGMTF